MKGSGEDAAEAANTCRCSVRGFSVDWPQQWARPETVGADDGDSKVYPRMRKRIHEFIVPKPTSIQMSICIVFFGSQHTCIHPKLIP